MVPGVRSDSCEGVGVNESGELCGGKGLGGGPGLFELVLTFVSCCVSPLLSEVWDCLGVLGDVCGLWSLGARYVFACV